MLTISQGGWSSSDTREHSSALFTWLIQEQHLSLEAVQLVAVWIWAKCYMVGFLSSVGSPVSSGCWLHCLGWTHSPCLCLKTNSLVINYAVVLPRWYGVGPGHWALCRQSQGSTLHSTGHGLLLMGSKHKTILPGGRERLSSHWLVLWSVTCLQSGPSPPFTNIGIVLISRIGSWLNHLFRTQKCSERSMLIFSLWRILQL